MANLRVTREPTVAIDSPVKNRSSLRAPTLQFKDSGSQIFQGGQQLAARAEQMQKEENVLTAKDIDNQYSAEMREIMEADDGYYNQKGKSAVDQFEAAQERLDALQAKYAGMSGNDHVSSLLAGTLNARKQNELNKVYTHKAQQRNIWADNTDQSSIENATNEAANAYNDPIYVAQNVAKGMESVDRVLSRAGIPLVDENGKETEGAKSARTKFTSGLYERVIEREAINDPMGAQKKYEAILSQEKATPEGRLLISPDAKMRIETSLKTKVTSAKGRGLLVQIKQDNPGLTDEQMLQKIYDHGDTTGDIDTADDAAQRFRQRISDKKGFKAENEKSVIKSAHKKINSTEWQGADLTLKDILSEEEYNLLSQSQYGIENAEKRIKRMREGISVDTTQGNMYKKWDGATAEQLVVMVEKGELDNDINGGSISDGDAQRYWTLYGNAKEPGKVTAEKAAAKHISPNVGEKLAAYLKRNEISTTKNPDSGELTSYLVKHIQDVKNASGAAVLDGATEDEIFAKATAPVNIPGEWFGIDTVPAYKAWAKEEASKAKEPHQVDLGIYEASEIAIAKAAYDSQRESITADLKAGGRPFENEDEGGSFNLSTKGGTKTKERHYDRVILDMLIRQMKQLDEAEK